MKITKTTVYGTMFLAALAIIFYLSIRMLWSVVSGAEVAVKTTIITAFVSVFVFVLGKWSERNKEAKQKITQEKISVYKKFVDFYFGLMAHEKIHGSPKNEHESMVEMLDFQRELIFWGSDAVISAYVGFKEDMVKFSQGSEAIDQPLAKRLAVLMTFVATVIAAMRRDIGYPFTNFDAAMLARFQLADDEETRMIFDHL